MGEEKETMTIIKDIIGIIVVIPLVLILFLPFDLQWELFEKKKYMKMDAFQRANPNASYEEYLAWEKSDPSKRQ